MARKIYNVKSVNDIPCPHCGRKAFRREHPDIYRCGYCGRLAWIQDNRTDAEKLRDTRREFNRLRNKPITGTRTRSTGTRRNPSPGSYVDGAGRTHFLKDGERLVFGEHGSRYIEDSKGLKTLGGTYFYLR